MIKRLKGLAIALLTLLCVFGTMGCRSFNPVNRMENMSDIQPASFMQSGRNHQKPVSKRKCRKAINAIEYYLGGIKLPADMEVLFNYQPTGFVQGGRNHQYTVFKLKDRPDNFLAENKFKVGGSAEIDKAYLVYTAYGKPVPDEFFPPWGEEFVWVYSFPVYLIYFETQQWLIAIVITN